MKSTRNMVLAALFIALGYVLPLFTAQIPALGNRFLPMHLPILIGGFVLGGPMGLVVGLITPVTRSLIFGMPPMFPTAIAMSFELGTFGLVTGLLYHKLPKKLPFVYVSLIAAMILGRVVWGLVSLILYGVAGNPFTWQIFMAGSIVNALPGIILQIILVPILVLALQKAKVIETAEAPSAAA